MPIDFEERALLEETLSDRAGYKVEIFTPQRGSKAAILELVESNAKHSFEQRFRVMRPTSKAIAEALQNALSLPEEPKRIESFDISHIQGTDTVASLVVWENGKMKNPTTASSSFVATPVPVEDRAAKTTILPACTRP